MTKNGKSKSKPQRASAIVGVADPVKVNHFLAFLKQAYEHYIKAQKEIGQPVAYVDAFMTAHNFHRMIIDDLIERTNTPGLAQAAVSTFEIGMLHRDQISDEAIFPFNEEALDG